MIKCPFCGFENEDGALFCEQCKSDLSGVEPTAPVQPEPAAGDVPMAEMVEDDVPMAIPDDAVPMADFAKAAPIEDIPAAAPIDEGQFDDAAPPMAEALPADDIPMAIPEEPPMAEATPAEPIPPAEPEPAPPVAEAAPPAPTPADPAPIQPAAEAPPPVEAAPAEPAAAEPVPAEPAPAAPAPPAAAEAPAGGLPDGAQPKLVVIRGQKINFEFPIYQDMNFIGRADEKPVDIDLEDQEPPDRIWCSRQHALITLENNQLTIEDLNSANGTYVNRNRVYPGQKQPLGVGDVIQIGTVQLKVKV